MILLALALGLAVALWLVARTRKRRSRGGPGGSPVVVVNTTDWSGPRLRPRKRGRQGNL